MRKWVAVVALMAGSWAQAQEPGVDRWGSMTHTDPITDAERVTAGVAEGGGLGILFQCSGGRFGAVLLPNTPQLNMEFITLDDSVPVAWRVDSEPAVTETWGVLPGRAGSSYAVVTTDAGDFSEAVLSAEERLVVRVHGITGIFTLDGAAQHIKKARAACEAD